MILKAREFKPYGINVDGGIFRPVLVLKEINGDQNLAIALGNIEAAVAVAQSNTMGSPVAIHKVTEQILTTLKIKPTRCLFDEIKAGHQYAQLDFEGSEHLTSLRARAEEVVSLCMQLGVPFFATEEFIKESRTFFHEMQGQALKVAVNPRLLNNPHAFMM